VASAHHRPSKLRSKAWPSAEPLLMILIWFAFAWFILWQATFGPESVWQDSESYVAIAAHPLWSTAFWAGTYPPLVPLFVKLTGSDSGFLKDQGLLAVAVWGFLAVTVSRLQSTILSRLAIFTILLAFATVTPIVLWNRSVLSESASLSLIAALFAGLIVLTRDPSWPKILIVITIAALMVSTRDSQLWTVGMLAVCSTVYAVFALRKDRRLGTMSAVLAFSLFAVVALASWGAQHSKRDVVSVESVLDVRVFPFPQRVAWFADHGMPQAVAIDNLAAQAVPPKPGQAQVVSISNTDPTFKALTRWERERGPSTFAWWVVTHPTFLIAEPLVRPERSSNDANGNLSYYAGLKRVDAPFTFALWPTWWWLLVATTAAAVSATVSGAWRSRTWRVIVVLTAVGILEMVVAWNADGQEAARHTIEGFLEVRLGVLVLLLLGIFGTRKWRSLAQWKRHGRNNWNALLNYCRHDADADRDLACLETFDAVRKERPTPRHPIRDW
jgi:hypothetical protein